MSNLTITTGNLLDLAECQTFDAIVHGCNCFHSMSGGIAAHIADRYPQVPRVDRMETLMGDPKKLGDYTLAAVNKRYISLPKFASNASKRELIMTPKFKVINGYTQFKPGADFIPSIFPVLLERLNKDFAGKHLGFPKLGAGIGGADWEEVELMLLKYMGDVKVTVIVYG